METKIREAKIEDLENIKRVYEAAGMDELKTYYKDESDEEIKKRIKVNLGFIFNKFAKDLKSGRSYWIVAENDGKVIAFAKAKIKSFQEGLLDRNYVKKEYRNQGIGKKLIKKRIEWLKQNQTKKVIAKLFINNKSSKKNLEDFGFETTEITMEKQLK